MHKITATLAIVLLARVCVALDVIGKDGNNKLWQSRSKLKMVK
jgi:hypothetical protein